MPPTRNMDAATRTARRIVTENTNPTVPPPHNIPLSEILEERGKQYGDFTVQGATAQAIKNSMREHIGWNRLSLHQKEALEMIAHKIARILNGSPTLVDSWQDIAGYAQLCADRCRQL